MSWFKGKILAIISSFLSRLLALLNLASMSLLQVNVFLALAFDLRYFTWKTKEKAIAICLVEWITCVILTFLSTVPLFDVDLLDVHVFQYRLLFFAQDKYLLALSMALFILSAIVFGVLVVRLARRKKLEVSQLLSETKLVDEFSDHSLSSIWLILCKLEFLAFTNLAKPINVFSYLQFSVAGWHMPQDE